MDSKYILSEDIKLLRFPLAVLIVFMHCDPIQDVIVFKGHNVDFAYNYIMYLTYFIARVLGDISVPLFFAISGYLFFVNAKKFDKYEYYNKLKKRSKTLLIPYLVWQILFLIKVIVTKINTGYNNDNPIYSYTPIQYLESLWFYPIKYSNIIGNKMFQWGAPINIPLWFVRDLIVTVCFSFLIFKILKDKKWGLIFLSLLFIFSYVIILPQWILPPGLNFISVFYFSAGAYIGIHKFPIINYLIMYKYYIFFVYIIIIVSDLLTMHVNHTCKGYEENNVIHVADRLVGIVFFITIASICVIKSSRNSFVFIIKTKISSYAKYAFILFAMHSLLHGLINKMLLSFFIKNNIYTLSQGSILCMYFLEIIMITVICCMFYEIINKLKLNWLFSGNR